jgi:hypothetical protein
MNTNITQKKLDLQNQFNAVYKKYLEDSLLYNSLFGSVFDFETKANEINPSTSTVCDDDIKKTEKIAQKFWRANLITSSFNSKENINTDDNITLTNSIKKIETLTLEEKKLLVDQIQVKFKNILVEIGIFMNIKPYPKTITPPLDTQSNEPDCDNIYLLVKDANRQVDVYEAENMKKLESINILLERSLNLSMEMANVLRELLDDYKLNFYANENVQFCENLLQSSEKLIKKIQSYTDDLISDLYSPDKIKSLKMIGNQLDTEIKKAQEKHDLTKERLNSYQSLGDRFDHIVEEYNTLKQELDKNTFTLKQIKQNKMHPV